MPALRLAFERNGAHAFALVGLVVGLLVALSIGELVLGGVVIAGTMWTYVLGYLGSVRERLRTERPGDWSRYERLVAAGEVVLSDSRVGTAPLPVVAGGLIGTFATLALLFAAVDPFALPTWTILLYALPPLPLMIPLALGSLAYRTRRYGPDVDVDVGAE